MEKNEIRKKLNSIRKRIGFLLLCKRALYGTVTGSAVFAVLALLSLAFPFPYAGIYGGIAFLTSVLAFSVSAAVNYPTLTKAAEAADSLGLKERAVTALENLDLDDDMSKIQRTDAARYIRKIDPYKDLKYVPNKKLLFTILGLFILILIGSVFETPAKKRAYEMKEVDKIVKEKEKETEEELRQVNEAVNLSEAEKKDLAELAEKTSKELSNARTKEGAKKAADRFETKLSDMLSEKISGSPEEEREEIVNNIKDYLANESALGNEPSKALSKAASQASDNMQTANSDSSNGQGQSGQSQSEQNQSGQSQSGQQSSQGQSGQPGQNQPGQSQSGQQSSQGQSGQAGQPDSQGGNNNQGDSGNNNSNGNGEGGNGTTTSANGQGSQNGNGNGGGWFDGSKDLNLEKADLSSNEKITIPSDMVSEYLHGKNTGEGNNESFLGETGFGYTGDATDYGDVVKEYTGRAYDRMNELTVPDAMQDIIKEYFSELNK